MKQKAYAAAGVDIDLGNRVKATLPQLLASTHRREVLGKVGGFGGLFALDVKKYREPVLVSSVDGVGTKLKLAFALDRHDTIGADLVNHCVNDIAVLGAEPLFFLDYLGTGKLEPHVFTDIIKGFARACAENNCAVTEVSEQAAWVSRSTRCPSRRFNLSALVSRTWAKRSLARTHSSIPASWVPRPRRLSTIKISPTSDSRILK